MPSPSSDIVQLLSAFAIAFTVPTYQRAMTLVYGTILSSGRRTVSSSLRAMGLGESKQYGTYHRVLSRAIWSPWQLSRMLLGLLVESFVPEGAAVVILIDETIEVRKGAKIKNKGWFRDPVRSTIRQVNYVLGLRWIVMALSVSVPWSQRPWALPFLAVPARSPKTAAKLRRRNWTIVQWSCHLIGRVHGWLPDREIVLVGDGSYAAICLVQRCQRLKQPVKFVSRLRLDAQLYAFPGPQPKGKRGPKPKKGERQPKLADRLLDAESDWQTMEVSWYSDGLRTVEYLTGVSLWHRAGQNPVELRWVLLRSPEQLFKPAAFFCSHSSVSPQQIVTWFILRWNIEVTFEDVRAYLGFGSQRHWSDRAIERTSPCLLGLFSLVTLMAHRLHGPNLPRQQASWYRKSDATFSDALAAVRLDLLQIPNYVMSSTSHDHCLFPSHLLRSLVSLVATAA
ncbi:MAG: transposase [Caldilineaceae bacterium]|nr:transposase [Caldilineaceae bacterium]